jgi:hypothetical protein
MSTAPTSVRFPCPASLTGMQRHDFARMIEARMCDNGETSSDGAEIVEGSGQLWWYEGEYTGQEYQVNHFGIAIPI